MKYINIFSQNRDVFVVIVLAFLYFISGKISLILLSEHKIVTLGMFVAEGISLGFALYFGKKVWVGVFLGQFLLALINDVGVLSSFIISSINSFEVVLAVVVFNKLNLNKELKTFKDIIGLSFMIIFILQVFGSVTSNLFLLFYNELSSDDLLYSIFSWWFGNTMGQLLFAPFLLLLFTGYRNIDFVNLSLYVISFSVFIYFLEIVLSISNPFLLFCLTIPIVVFIVLKKGMFYGLSICVATSMISSFSLYIKVGTFTLSSPIDNTINYNLFILVYVLTIFVMGIFFEDRKRYEIRLKKKIKEGIKKNQDQELILIQQNKLAQMGEMIAMIAHQWRQPLSSISSTASSLEIKAQLGTLNDEFILVNTQKIQNFTKYLSDTIDDFRNFFKNDKKRQDVRINDIVLNSLKIIEDELKNHNININLDLKSQSYIFTYKNELQQTILNIIKNAEDALVENKIKMPIINITSDEDSKYVYLHVEDNGGGIKDEIKDKIFEPYFSTKGKNGTGLGLYMSKIIVEKHCKAKLYFRNGQNGSIFSIKFKKDIVDE